MTAAAAEPSGPGDPPFADASPSRIRAALTEDDAAAFDRQWRVLMARATEQLDLREVHEALEAWRRVARVTSTHGATTYQQALASARARLQTGERSAGAVPWAQMKAELGLTE